jgi:polysaccharide export outer membrane protein
VSVRRRRVLGRLLLAPALAGAIGVVGAGGSAAQEPDSLPSGVLHTAAAPIRPGDRIVLRVWREPMLSETLTVNQSGNIVLPRIGVYPVASQTVGSLPDSLRQRYSEYLRNPSIEVTVLRRVGVLGEVRKPDLYWVDVTMTLPDVIAVAGGVTDIGNPNNVRIVRGGKEIKVGRWERGGTYAADLLSGDQIVVSRTSWLSRNALAVVSAAGVLTSIIITIFRL